MTKASSCHQFHTVICSALGIALVPYCSFRCLPSLGAALICDNMFEAVYICGIPSILTHEGVGMITNWNTDCLIECVSDAINLSNNTWVNAWCVREVVVQALKISVVYGSNERSTGCGSSVASEDRVPRRVSVVPFCWRLNHRILKIRELHDRIFQEEVDHEILL